jgi:hypothetical protein
VLRFALHDLVGALAPTASFWPERQIAASRALGPEASGESTPGQACDSTDHDESDLDTDGDNDNDGDDDGDGDLYEFKQEDAGLRGRLGSGNRRDKAGDGAASCTCGSNSTVATSHGERGGASGGSAMRDAQTEQGPSVAFGCGQLLCCCGAKLRPSRAARRGAVGQAMRRDALLSVTTPSVRAGTLHAALAVGPGTDPLDLIGVWDCVARAFVASRHAMAVEPHKALAYFAPYR